MMVGRAQEWRLVSFTGTVEDASWQSQGVSAVGFWSWVAVVWGVSFLIVAGFLVLNLRSHRQS